MYQPWGDPAADAIIKLIDEREKKEVKYSSYENDLVSYKQLREHTDKDRHKHLELVLVEQETSAGQWRRDPRQVDPRARDTWDRDPAASSRAAVVPARSWGYKIAGSINNQLKTGIDVALTVRNRSNSNSSDEIVELRPTRRHASPQEYAKLSRSRSRSLPRDRKLYRRSRSNPRITKRRNRSNSASGDGKRKRSVSRDTKRERSDSRDRKRRKNSSTDRKTDRSDQYRSSSRSTEKKRDTRSPCKRSPTPKVDKPAETTTQMLSKFVSMIQEVKTKESAPAHTAPNPNVLPEFDSSNIEHAIIPWLLRVDDVAKLFGWGDKETIQYALPKLVGDAKTWYMTLETVPYTWADWKKKLKEQFPGPSYGRLLMDMNKRLTISHETLEKYYYDKMLLVNRCGFRGEYAVACILHGIKLDSIRLCAEAADFAEPEQLLKYLKSVENVWLQHNATSIKATEDGLPGQKKASHVICSLCGKKGHEASVCWSKEGNSNAVIKNPDQPKKIIICNVCGKKGHKSFACRFKDGNSNAVIANPDQPKKIKICSLCGKKGHEASVCWFKDGNSNAVITNPDQPKKIIICTVCGKKGHTALNCWSQKGFSLTNAQKMMPQKMQKFKIPLHLKQKNIKKEKLNLKCTFCMEVGHTKSNCRRLKKAAKESSETGGSIVVPADASIFAPSDTSILPSTSTAANQNHMNEPQPAPPGVDN